MSELKGERIGKMPKVHPDSEKEKASDSKSSDATVSYLSLYRYAEPSEMWVMALGIIGAMGGGVLMPLFSVIFGEFMNAFGNPDETQDFMAVISDIALKFVYIALGALGGMYLEVTCFMWAGNRQANRLRMKYVTAVVAQEVAFFDTSTTTSSLLQGLNEDSNAFQMAISDKASNFIHHVSTFVAGYIIALVIAWDLALVMVGLLPFLAAAGWGIARVISIKEEANTSAYAQAGGIAQQSLGNVRTIQAFNSQDACIRSYTRALEEPSKVNNRMGAINGFCFGFLQLVMFCSYAVAFFYGAYRIAAGVYTGGDVVSVQFATLMGSFALGQAAPCLQYFSAGRVAGFRIFKVIERIPAMYDVGGFLSAMAAHQEGAPTAGGGSPKSLALTSTNGLDKINVKSKGDDAQNSGLQLLPHNGNGELPKVQGELLLENVTFSYPARPDIVVFDNFCLKISAGTTVALVGSSGSGKSTAVQLIERFYDPMSGRLLLDGVDLRSLSVKWLRSQIGLVSQEPTLFATTIYENIAIGRKGATKQEVEEAAAAANAHKFIISLPDGYQTEVGEKGVQMSGGQKQRLAIARAILKNPKILLLDEATSALDSQSERLVQAALDRMVVGRTTVVVAHRLSTIKHADAIAVVGGGKVAELGTHEELLTNPIGAYSNLVKLQMQAGPGQSAHPAAASTSTSDAPAWVSLKGGPESKKEEEGEKEMSLEEIEAMELKALEEAKVEALERGSAPLRGSATLRQSLEKGAPLAGAGSGQLKLASSSELPATKLTEKEQQALDEEAGKKVPMSRLLKLNRPEAPALVAGAIGSAVAGATQPIFAFVLVDMILIFYLDDYDEMKRKASFYACMFLVIGVGSFVAVALQQACLGWASTKLSQRVRLLLLGSFLNQEISFFDDDMHNSSRLSSVLSADATYIRGAAGDSIGVIFQNASTLAVGYIIAFIYDWRMTLLVTGAFPILIVASVIQMQFYSGSTSANDKQYAGANQQMSEGFASIRVIYSYNLQSYLVETYSNVLTNVNRTSVKQAHFGGIAMGFSFFTTFALYGLVIYFGGWEVSQGLTDFEGMFKAFLAIVLAGMGLAQAGMVFPDLGKAKAAVGRVFPLLDRVPAINAASEEGNKPAETSVKGLLEFQHISFVYPNRPAVIIYSDFNLTVQPGQMCALVGESGSGKSTVVALMQRFYDPQSGVILLDGVDIRTYNLRWLRQQMGLVSQEPVLFSGSIAENIRYGNPEASLEELQAAAAAANAMEFIEKLPEGFDTLVGEGGIQLSGGQKQRVAIARAVVKNPKILLLDEATSALDAKSEGVVQAALDTIMAGRTSLVIAHRLTTIRKADTINVVYRGVILEQGNHAQLMVKKDGAYARLVQAQEAAHRQEAS